MAEVKFKAWDKQTATLREVLVIDWLNKLVDLSGGIIERKFNEVILMQYTGISDRNGTKVYDGYICNHYGRFGIEKGVIKFLRHGFHILLDGGAMFRADEFYLEVLGNIYENPELLERS